MTLRNLGPTNSRIARSVGLLALVVVCLPAFAFAQSTDIAAPSAVQTNEVTGSITPRDIGDARLTDHFYAFSGTPGDLLITVDARNLNGDVDVFSSVGLRPLLKFVIHAGSASPVTKSIYLRKREDFILRIEARSPNDDEGSYRLRFGGSFEPITSGPLLAASENAPVQPSLSSTGTGRRVSSSGARLPEPPPEVAAVPTPEPEPTPATESETAKAETTEETKPASRPTGRTGRGRRPAGRRTRAPQPVITDENTRAEAENKPVEEVAKTDSESTARERPATRRGGSRRSAQPTPAVEPEPETGPRLIIETNDGTMIDRYMSSVRRVTVENGRVVVVGKDGKIERIELSSIVRMSIAP